MSTATLAGEEVVQVALPAEKDAAEAIPRRRVAAETIRRECDDDGPIPLICGLFAAVGAFVGAEICILLCAGLECPFFSPQLQPRLVGWGFACSLGAGCAYLWIFHGLTSRFLSQATYTLCVIVGTFVPFALHVLQAAAR